MTATHRSIGTAAAAAVATAAVFTIGLSVQHAREAWPFTPTHPPAPRAAVNQAAGGTRDRVPIDAAAAGALDIRLATVGRETLRDSWRATAIVVPDESRIAHVHTRVAGWVERLDVNTTGESVRAGQSLAGIFSQELLASQIEYLSARRNVAAAGLSSLVVASGRARLGVLGMTEAEIEAVEASGEPRRLVTVPAPQSGVVVDRGVTVGTAVDPSTTLLTIADLSRVWVFAEVPEAHVTGVRVGSNAELDFPASGLAPFAAKVEFLYPTLTERTRTLRVRLSAANRRGRLRPGLYGTATFELAGDAVLTVPRDAVVDTGLTQHVFVVSGERFEPRTVTVGRRVADRVEVRAGLKEGELVVAAGVFLLDSESRLRATGGGAHQHATPAGAAGSMPDDSHPGHEPPPSATAVAPDPVVPRAPHDGHQE